jgi:hypothetical protein
MRYRKGCIALSEEHDLPVLLYVRNARAITLDQIYRLLVSDRTDTVRRSVLWRMSRLETSGLVERLPSSQLFRQPVYRITALGLSFLESRGHALVALPSTCGQILHETQVFHATELVSIRLALRESNLLTAWQTELEVASRNLVFYGGVAKDYDALARIQERNAAAEFAIEYERTVKASARYNEIRAVLNQDSTTNVILYLASNHDVLHVLAVELRGVKKAIGLALSDDFRRDLLDTQVLNVNGTPSVVPFREMLSTFQSSKEASNRTPLTTV